MTSTKGMEQRAAIIFCVKAGMTPSDTWKFILFAENYQKCSRSLVFISSGITVLPTEGQTVLMTNAL